MAASRESFAGVQVLDQSCDTGKVMDSKCKKPYDQGCRQFAVTFGAEGESREFETALLVPASKEDVAIT